MSAAGQQWPRCTICGETRNHRQSCNDDWHRRNARQSSKDKMRAGVDFIDAALANSYNPAWNSTCPACRSATRYSGGLHHCTKCAYSFTGRRPPRQNHPV